MTLLLRLALALAWPARAANFVVAPVEARPLGPSAAAAVRVVLTPAGAETARTAIAAPLPSIRSFVAPVAAGLTVRQAPAPAVTMPARVAAMTEGAGAVIEALNRAPALSDGGAAHDGGEKLENLLTGGLSAPAVAAGAAETAATPEDLDFVAGAGADLGRRADDLGAARGQKAGRMSGADFIALVDAARRAADAEPARTAEAAKAAAAVRAALLRVVTALVPVDKPLSESVARALSVWQVFDQEMAVAAKKGTLSAVTADAELFASQVEASVAPALAAPRPAPEEVHPEDPEGYATISQPGSVFGWAPIEDSPGHGFPPFDALIRSALREKKTATHAAGFELPGASRRADARIHFYGERHTDGELIKANMARLVADARPGAPLIVLVEGYTGWSLRGWDAVKYLADRGLEPGELSAKGVTSDLLEVRGWDTIDGYGASKHPLLQHHMDLLELNRLAHSGARGWRYYRDFARAAWTAAKGWAELWRVAIVARNGDLDRAVAKAAAEAERDGASVAVIAGTDHLLERPRLAARLPWLFKPSFRKSLAAAVGGRPYWASTPPTK